MRRLRQWLLPLFTLLAVLMAAFLPQYLSQLRDRRLMGALHSEDLAVESGLPIHPPDLAQRVELLDRWMEASDVITVQQEVMDTVARGTLVDGVFGELYAFVEAGLLPEELMPREISLWSCSRLYLQQEFSSSLFYVVEAYSKDGEMAIRTVLDGETGYMLCLELRHPAMEAYYGHLSLLEIGVFYFERHGFGAKIIAGGPFTAQFQAFGMETGYMVVSEPYSLKIFPTALVEYSGGGITATDGSMDAE